MAKAKKGAKEERLVKRLKRKRGVNNPWALAKSIIKKGKKGRKKK